jgi:hypothetical protein
MPLIRPSAEELDAAPPEELANLAAELMARLKPGRQPLPFFTQIARLVTLSTFEVTPFRTIGSKVEVLLAKRPDTQDGGTKDWWPGKLHLPGNVVLPAEEIGIRSYDNLADTILTDEFGGSIARTSPVTLYNAQPRTGERGSEQTVFGWADVDLTHDATKPIGGDFYDAEAVLSNPKGHNVLAGHELNIEMALGKYILQLS